MTAKRTSSRVGWSDGKSVARKKGPLEVPPRITIQGILVCMMSFNIELEFLIPEQRVSTALFLAGGWI
jgi:hypothetical protein